VQLHRGFLNARFLFRQAEVDLALFPLQRAYDFRLRGFKAGALHFIASRGEIQFILLRCDTRLSLGLVERGLRLAFSANLTAVIGVLPTGLRPARLGIATDDF